MGLSGFRPVDLSYEPNGIYQDSEDEAQNLNDQPNCLLSSAVPLCYGDSGRFAPVSATHGR